MIGKSESAAWQAADIGAAAVGVGLFGMLLARRAPVPKEPLSPAEELEWAEGYAKMVAEAWSDAVLARSETEHELKKKTVRERFLALEHRRITQAVEMIRRRNEAAGAQSAVPQATDPTRPADPQATDAGAAEPPGLAPEP